MPVFISEQSGTFCDENNIPSLRSQSWDIAQYPEIANQSNCAILGGSRVAYTNKRYVVGNYYEMKARDMKGHLLNARDIVY